MPASLCHDGPYFNAEEPSKSEPASEEQSSYIQKVESLSAMAGGLAHHLNNLLLGVLGNAELALLDMPSQSPARQSVEEINLAAQRASALVKKVLIFSGRAEHRLREVKPDERLSELERPLIERFGQSHKLTFRIHRVSPIHVDWDQLQLALEELLMNAVEAMPQTPGQITIELTERCLNPSSLHELPLPLEATAGRYVILSVSDSGVGMNPTTQRRAFDPFFSTKFPGRGLGLATVLGIMRSHHGTLGLSSSWGAGTTLRLYFPAS